MTKQLEKAFGEASKLPEIEQNALARWVLAEIEADRKWNKQFSDSEEELVQLAQEASKDDEEGKTSDLDINRL